MQPEQLGLQLSRSPTTCDGLFLHLEELFVKLKKLVWFLWLAEMAPVKIKLFLFPDAVFFQLLRELAKPTPN
jgi:hypothetical protein